MDKNQTNTKFGKFSKKEIFGEMLPLRNSNEMWLMLFACFKVQYTPYRRILEIV
jgi:hypothetical protein